MTQCIEWTRLTSRKDPIDKLLLHAYTKPHIANTVKVSLQEFDQEALLDSPNLVHVDYYFFRSEFHWQRKLTTVHLTVKWF